MSEYEGLSGYEGLKSLHEILEELAFYCHMNGAPKPIIKVQLPKVIVEKYSKQFEPKEDILLIDPPPAGLLSCVWFTVGTVEIEIYE